MLNVCKNGQQLSLDAGGNLLVNIASGGAGGAQYVQGATQSSPTGTVAMGKNPSNVVNALSLDASGNLNVNLAAGSISGGNAAASPTGSAVPTSADYLGFNSSGSLVGVSAANPLPVVQQGSVAVTGTFWQSTQPVSLASLPALAAGAANIGAVEILDSGGSNKLAVNSSGQIAISNFPASQAVTGTFWQATQPVSLSALPALTAGSANIGGVEIFDSGGVNKLTVNASGQIGISNFPASQPVTGTFWQTTQPVSVSSVSGTILTSDAADGAVGGAAPTTAVLDGGSDGMYIRPIRTDARGQFQVAESGGVSDVLNLLLLETRAMRSAIVAMVTESGQATVSDFDPANYYDAAPL